jgi:hypothetical protein
MRVLISLFLCLFVETSFAKDALIKDCEHLQSIKQADFVLLNKKEFIELGECVAENLIKTKFVSNLPLACSEVIEDKLNPLGILSLTKLEAIYMGQCLGVINYIYQHYHNEMISINYSYNRNRKKYHCIKGVSAAKRLSVQEDEQSTRYEVRDLLCEVR